MRKIKLTTKDGPFGDATTLYNMSFEGTLGELIDEILEDKDEWGYISVIKDPNAEKLNPWNNYKILWFRRGEIEQSEIECDLNTKVCGIHAQGGWTFMEYIIKFAD